MDNYLKDLQSMKGHTKKMGPKQSYFHSLIF